LKNTQYKQSQSVALRVIKDGKTGYAASTSMGKLRSSWWMMPWRPPSSG